MAEPKETPPGDPKGEKGRFSETVERLKKNEKIGEWSEYAKSNKFDTVSYIILIIGLIFMFFDPWIGGALIGIVFGFYYSREIVNFFFNIHLFVEEQGIVRTLVLGATLLGALILNVAFFIAAAIGVGIKQLYVGLIKKD